MARPNVRRVCRVTLVRRVTLRRGIGGVTSVGRSSSVGVRAGAAAGRLPRGVPGPRALVRSGPARRSPTGPRARSHRSARPRGRRPRDRRVDGHRRSTAWVGVRWAGSAARPCSRRWQAARVGARWGQGPFGGVHDVGYRGGSAPGGWDGPLAGVGGVGRWSWCGVGPAGGAARRCSWRRWGARVGARSGGSGALAGLRGRRRPPSRGACLRVVRGRGAAWPWPACARAVVARADRLVVDVGRRTVGLRRRRAGARTALRRAALLHHRSAAARGLDPADGPSSGRRARRAPGVAAAGWAGWRAERALGSAVAVHRPHPPPPCRRVAARGARSRDGLIDEDDTNGPRVRRSGTDRPVPVHLGDHADALGTGMIAASRTQRRSPPP